MRTVLAYNKFGYFTKAVEQNIDELSGEYPNLINATDVALPKYNPNLEIPKFVDNTWILEDLKETGIFYLKSDATEFREIVKKDADLYTTIKPLPKYDDGTKQIFNDSSWEYTFKGADLLELERLEELEKRKKLKLAQLETDFNSSKKIILQNGNTLVINHDCPKRDYFLNILEDVKRLDDNMEISHIFTQKSSGLGFKVSPFIANYILLKDFTENVDNRIIKVREHNKAIVYDNAENKIEQATSIEELEAINWNFLKPNGIEININERVADIMNGDDENLKGAVERVTDKNGQLHFIKTLDELEL